MATTKIDTKQLADTLKSSYWEYVSAINDFNDFTQGNPYQLMLFEAIENLIERKTTGDLKDIDDVPREEDIRGYLKIAENSGDLTDPGKNVYGIFSNRFQIKKDIIEEYGYDFVEELRSADFARQLNSLPIALKFEIKAEILEALRYSDAGREYIRESASFDDQQEDFLLFSFESLVQDLKQLEELERDPAQESLKAMPDISIKIMEIIHGFLPDVFKYTQVNITKAYFVIGRFSKVFFQDFGLVVPSNHTAINIVEFELTFIEVREIEIKNKFKQNLGPFISFLKIIFSSYQLWVGSKALRRDSSIRDKLNISKLAIEIITESEALFKAMLKHPTTGIAKASKLSNAISVLGKFNSWVISPILFFYEVDDFSHAAMSGDKRDTWVAFWASLSALSTIGLASVGVAGPVGIIVPLALGLVSLAGYLIYGTKMEEDLERWLESNYFGKDFDLEALPSASPFSIEFEWIGADEERKIIEIVPNAQQAQLRNILDGRDQLQQVIFRQIRTLHSILHPLNATAKKSNADEDALAYRFLKIKLDNPSIAPIDFYLRLRFINIEGREDTNTAPPTDSNQQVDHLDWYLIPVLMNREQTAGPDWKDAPHNWWFVGDDLKLIEENQQNQQILKRIESYEVVIRIGVLADQQYDFMQVQILPFMKGGNLANPIQIEDLPSTILSNPLIITQTVPVSSE